MKKPFKEAILWVFIVLPYVYLAVIWDQLPDRIATHFNLAGEANGWSDKNSLLYLPGAFGVGLYLLLLAVPFIDPKKKIQQMGSNYYKLRLMLTVFISLLWIFILYMADTGSMKQPNLLFALIGILFFMLGNYFQTIRPNYFIGIRTPWTLENEDIWKKTHRMGGKIWMVGGSLIVLLAFLVGKSNFFVIAFTTITIVIALVPVVYSYLEFRRGQKGSHLQS